MKYIYIICPFIALIICQIIKFIVESIKNKKINIERLFNGSGGMPSTHATFSSSLTVLIGYLEGFDSAIFAVALIFMCITAYDALGVRWETGKQAETINLIVENFIKGKPKNAFNHLKEQIGHQPLEVFVGLLLGTVVASIFSLI